MGAGRGGDRWAGPGGTVHGVCALRRKGSGTEPRTHAVSKCLALPVGAMAENSDKVPITLVGPDDVEFCSPPVSTAGISSPPAG